MRADGRRGRAGRARGAWTGTPAIDVAAGVRRRSSRRAGSAVTLGARLHPRERRPLLLPARRPHRPVRRGSSAHERPDGRRGDGARHRPPGTSSPPGSARVRAPDRGRAAPRPDATPATSSSLVVVTKFFPASDVAPARRPRRPRRGGEPRPGGRGEADRRRCSTATGPDACTSSASCSPTRPPRSSPTPTSSTPLDRAKVVAALGRAADHAGPAARRPRPGQPRRRAGPRRRRRRRTSRRPGRRGRRRTRRSTLGGVMAVAPLGADPDAAFARLWEVARRAYGPDHPQRHLGVRGHERGPRGRGPARGDTPACRERNPRFASAASLTSLRTTVDRCFIALPREFHDGWGASQDDGVPRACRGRRPLRRRRAPRRVARLRRRAPRALRATAAERPRPARGHPAAPAPGAGGPAGPRAGGRVRSTGSRRSTRAPTTRPRPSGSRSATGRP